MSKEDDLLDRSVVQALTTAPPEQLQAYLEELAKRTESKRWATSTIRQYASQWRLFVRFCERLKYVPLPAEVTTLRHFVTAECYRLNNRGTIRRVGGIRQALAAIRFVHHLKRLHAPIDHPDVIGVLAGRTRAVGHLPVEPAEAVTVPDLLAMLSCVDLSSVVGIRDRALLAIGWTAALRRSEITRLLWRDVRIHHDGVILTIRDSKWRPGGADDVGCPAAQLHPLLCPVASMTAWAHCIMQYVNGEMTSSPDAMQLIPVFPRIRIHDGAIIGGMKEKDVTNILQFRAQAAGISTEFTSHSLRNGWGTWASENGIPLALQMLHMRHRNVSSTARYTQQGPRFADHPSMGLY